MQIDDFKRHIEKNFPTVANEKILIAVSGGLDSMTLTDLCQKSNYDISLAHCNFSLRGDESDSDEIFIKDFGLTHKINVFTKKFDTRAYSENFNQSIQMAARELRYNWFRYLQEKYNFKWVLTAHHADDNLETFLINLNRGSGIEGLKGIPVVNNSIVRPLLIFNRQDLLSYAIKNNLKWREDCSNSSFDYQRNLVRHKIIPVLKEVFPDFIMSLNKTQKYLKSSSNLIANHISGIEDYVISFSSDDEKHYDLAKIQLLKSKKSYLFPLFAKYGFTDWDELYNLFEAQSGKQISSNNYSIIKDRKVLILLSKNAKLPKSFIINSFDDIIYIEHMNSKLKIDESPRVVEKSPNIIYVDTDKLILPLEIRPWRNGDYFFPIGFNKKKKLSKFFKDEKLSVVEKSKVMLLCNNNQIIWVIGIRQDSRYVPNEFTSSISKISINHAIIKK